MYSNYGEAWTNPIISGGMVGGYMEAWAMSGLLDVREVILEDNTSLPEFLDALEEFSTYQENFLSNIIRVKAFSSTKVEDLDDSIIEQFKNKGYQRIRNWLVKGPVIDREYQERENYC